MALLLGWRRLAPELSQSMVYGIILGVRHGRINRASPVRLKTKRRFLMVHLYLCLPDRCGQKIHKSKRDRQCKIRKKENVCLFWSYVFSVRTGQTDRGINAPLVIIVSMCEVFSPERRCTRQALQKHYTWPNSRSYRHVWHLPWWGMFPYRY